MKWYRWQSRLYIGEKPTSIKRLEHLFTKFSALTSGGLAKRVAHNLEHVHYAINKEIACIDISVEGLDLPKMEKNYDATISIYALFEPRNGLKFSQIFENNDNYYDGCGCLVGFPITDQYCMNRAMEELNGIAADVDYHNGNKPQEYHVPYVIPEPQRIDLDKIEKIVKWIREELNWPEAGLNIMTTSGI
jgi:hypothetical protein